MTGRLLLDEMLAPAIADQLKRRGLDVEAVARRTDLAALPDDQVLAVGVIEDRVVVTLNIVDFAGLHSEWQAAGRSHAGLVLVSTASFPQDGAFVGAVVESLAAAARSGELPGRGQASFLRRSPG